MSGKTNRDLYSEYWTEINKRELSNSESFDKAILSLSSAGLALSLSFIKFVIPLEQIKDATYLYYTWYLFGASIIFTIISFGISQKALRVNLDYADKCFNKEKNEFCNKKNNWGILVDWLNIFVSVIFISAIISVIMFTSNNFEIKDTNMAKKVLIEKGASIPSMQPTVSMDGANVPAMQKIPSGDTVTNGANIPKMQPTQPTEKSTSTTKEK